MYEQIEAMKVRAGTRSTQEILAGSAETDGERLDPDGDLPIAEHVADRLLTLPLYVGMSGDDADPVVQAVREVLC